MTDTTATDDLWRTRPEVIRRFLDLLPNHEKLCQEVAYILKKLVQAERIEFAAVSWRTKSLDSFCEKLVRRNIDDPLKQVTDLAGVRLVYLYASDRERIAALIENQFQIVRKIDKIKEIGPDRFGYGAVHYLVRLGKHSIGARYDDLVDLLCEVQIRTVLQDSWGIVAHHLSYKQESDVPEELRRRLNALAGMFETADDQFDRLRDERSQYAEHAKQEICSCSRTSLEANVNLDNLTEYLAWRFPNRIAPSREDVANLLDDIRPFGYTTLSDLDQIVTQTEKMVKAYESKFPPLDENGDEPSYTAIGALKTAIRIANKSFRDATSSARLIAEIEDFLVD